MENIYPCNMHFKLIARAVVPVKRMQCLIYCMSPLHTVQYVEVLVCVGLGTVRLLYNLQEFQSFEATL